MLTSRHVSRVPSSPVGVVAVGRGEGGEEGVGGWGGRVDGEERESRRGCQGVEMDVEAGEGVGWECVCVCVWGGGRREEDLRHRDGRLEQHVFPRQIISQVVRTIGWLLVCGSRAIGRSAIVDGFGHACWRSGDSLLDIGQ